MMQAFINAYHELLQQQQGLDIAQQQLPNTRYLTEPNKSATHLRCRRVTSL